MDSSFYILYNKWLTNRGENGIIELPKKERMLEMKKVVWIDDCGNKWENLKDWRRLHVCPNNGCLTCPLSRKNNGLRVLCDKLTKEYPERVVELMQGRLCRAEVEVKNLFQNTKTGKEILCSKDHFLMTEFCREVWCDDCPVRERVEEDGFGSCVEWMREHWEESLELLGWRMVEEKKEDGEQRENGEQKMEKMEKMKIRHKESGQTVEINPEDVLATQLCFREHCGSCPLNGYDCTEWVSEHLNEALKIFGFEKVGDAKLEEAEKEDNKQETSEYDYFLMRHLGVGYRERFQVEGTDGVYHVGVAGRLFRVYDRDGSRKREIVDGQVLYTLLEHPERVKKGLTAEHREYLEAVMKVFPEVQWVKRDGGWLLFGSDKLVLLSRENRDWEELKDGEERDVRELLGK